MDHVLIAGGGVIGLTIARELAAVGFRVTLLDRQTCGREASWAGAGILPPACPGPRDDPLVRLTAAAQSLWPALSEELRDSVGIDNGFRRCGGLMLPTQAVDLPELTFRPAEPTPWEEELAAWQAAGTPVKRLDGRQLRELEPQLSRRLTDGLFLPDLCQVRNPWHLRALAADCRRRGVQIVEGTAVERLWREGERVRGVETAFGRWEADRVVIACGAWSQRLLPPELGPPPVIEPIRGQIVLLRSPTPVLSRVVECGHRYLVPREDGRVLVGSTEERVGFDKQTTPEGVAGLRAFAGQLVPALRGAEQEQAWAGLRPQARRGRPIIGPVPGTEGLSVAAGHFRSGLLLSPITARLMRAHLCGEGHELAAAFAPA